MSEDHRKRKLLSPERERLIFDALAGGAKTIFELSETLEVSEATIRRDLLSLESQGRIRRVHGGAELLKFPQTEPVFTEKASINRSEKEAIARLALDYIDDADTIFIDGGSTALELAKHLGEKKDLTVVTNSIMAAAELMESVHHLIIVGGEFRSLSRTLVGPLTAQTLNALKIGKAFLGTIGFDTEDGLSTTDPNEAFTKELVMRRSDKVFVLADSSKFTTSSLVLSGTLDDIDMVITDSKISQKALKALKARKIEVVFKA
jgi:DeoR family transcriptional regulator, fructose operon transcriptional repressor